MDVEEALMGLDNERARLDAIQKSCGLLRGALARVLCARGHQLSTHTTHPSTTRER
jgi:hypothetical protein